MEIIYKRLKLNLYILLETTATVTNSLTICSIIEREKLIGPNFLDWFRQLKIVLKLEREEYVPEEPIPDELLYNFVKN